MLEALLTACDNTGVSADPSSVTTDFEVAAMQAERAKLGSDVSAKLHYTDTGYGHLQLVVQQSHHQRTKISHIPTS